MAQRQMKISTLKTEVEIEEKINSNISMETEGEINTIEMEVDNVMETEIERNSTRTYHPDL